MSKLFQSHVMGSPFLHGIAIHSEALKAGESGLDLAFKSFCSQTQVRQSRSLAFGAGPRRLGREVTAMA